MDDNGEEGAQECDLLVLPQTKQLSHERDSSEQSLFLIINLNILCRMHND